MLSTNGAASAAVTATRSAVREPRLSPSSSSARVPSVEHRGHRRESDGAGHERADRHDQPDLEQRGQGAGDAQARDRPEWQLEPDREHQQDHAELRQHVHELGVGHQRHRHVRADHQTGQHVAEHDRHAQRLEHDGDRCSAAQHDHELDEDARGGHRDRSPACGRPALGSSNRARIIGASVR
jgi:hypothetical protein